MGSNWYMQKLLDVRWQKKKNRILDRDNYTCQNKKCGSTTETMHVHHKHYTYGKDPWDYPDEVLTTLCHNCHKNEHKPLNIMQVIGELVKPPTVIEDMNWNIKHTQEKLNGQLSDEETIEVLKEVKNLQNKRNEIYRQIYGKGRILV